MIKNLVKLEHECEGKICHLLCDNDMPIAKIREALCVFMQHIGNIEDSILQQQKLQDQISQSVADDNQLREPKESQEPDEIPS